MPILGGSPLGLIGVSSQPTKDGMSTFNAGKSRNIDVNKYNLGKGKTSIFTGGSRLNPWPNIKTVGGANNVSQSEEIGDGTMGVDADGRTIYKSFTRNTLHNNDVYDTSMLNIIEKLSLSRAGALRPSDFAYLKNLGVFPNNRLMIARKFPSPVGDDLNRLKTVPKSILITWKPETEEFLDMTVGEHWTDADADFTNVLNRMGEDMLGKNMGAKIGAAMNLLPLPGFTETIQQTVLQKLGVLSSGTANKGSPAGNPNLIKMAKRRKTSGSSGDPFSGLKYEISIKMLCEYEQKFISGIDPTIAFIDIIGNILAFGTQDSSTYGLSGKFAGKIAKWSNEPDTLITDFAALIKDGFAKVQESIKKAVSEATEAIKKQIAEVKKSNEGKDEDEDYEEPEGASEIKALEKQNSLITKAGNTLKNFIQLIGKSIKNTIRKYREELRGIASALSGGPSTPWHVTIGNPLRPIFCSGDMYTEEVKISLGPTLAFNDLPSSIKVDFVLKPGRPCGLQEIMAKFNTGNLRVVNVRRDLNQTENPLDRAQYMYEESSPAPVDGNPNSANSQNVNNSSSGSSGGTRENSTQETNNRDGASSSATNGSSSNASSSSSSRLPANSSSANSGTSASGTSGT